jgi:sugar lactone lactonase YvrE
MSKNQLILKKFNLRLAAIALVGIFLTSSFGIVSAEAWESGPSSPDKVLALPDGSRATSIAFDSSGRMYVTDFSNNAVYVFASNWVDGVNTPIKVLQGANTGLTTPTSIGFDSDGLMYVVNGLGVDTVTVYANDWADGNTSPVKTLQGAATGLSFAYAIAFDSEDNMYITNYGNDKVTRHDKGWATGNTPPSRTLSQTFQDPRGLAFDSQDQMYVVSVGQTQVRVYADDWQDGATEASFTAALNINGDNNSISIDSDENLYVTSRYQLDVYEPSWSLNSTPFKTMTGLDIQLSLIAIDASDNLYVPNWGTVSMYAASSSITSCTIDGQEYISLSVAKGTTPGILSISPSGGNRAIGEVITDGNLLTSTVIGFSDPTLYFPPWSAELAGSTLSFRIKGVDLESDPPQETGPLLCSADAVYADSSSGNQELQVVVTNYFVVEGFKKGKHKLSGSMKNFIKREIDSRQGESKVVCTGTVRGKKWTEKREALALARAEAGCAYVSILKPNLPIELKKRLILKGKGNPLTVRIRVFY